MANRDRIAIFPSRANNVLMKNRLVSANKGLSMLKKKRDALELKLRDLIVNRRTYASNSNEIFKDAIFSIAKANFLETDFKPTAIIGSDRADAFMRLTFLKTIGLTLPTFEPVLRKPESVPLTGLSRGGKQVEVIREKFQELLKVLVIIASHDYSIKILNDAIRSTNTRMNGLEYVIIPRLMNTSAYIINELDETEREEFYRLKRSQHKQKALKDKTKEKQKPRSVEPESLMQMLQKLDASTSIDFRDVATLTDFANSIVQIFRKNKISHPTQTIISGHYASSDEMVSPTDSILSGTNSIFNNKSGYLVEEMQRSLAVLQAEDEDKKPSTSATRDRQHKPPTDET